MGICKLSFECALVAFHYIPGSHTGAKLAKKLLHLIDHAGISLDKFCTDRTFHDGQCLESSRTLRENHEFTFDPIDCHVCCLPHIYNICVQHTLNNYADADFIHCPQIQHRTNFWQTILSGNKQEWFVNDTGDIVKLPVVQLLRDVRTHWDSTYYMINRMRALWQAIDFFFDAPHKINISDSKLAPLDWEVL
ncbi:hypothetical protein BS17DRAFT_818233 [Gyrodon lividus]|nr:hypothetical protein BS17DRAFT_818233 [Gyrodon lividus]